jgi:hypothetical protein
MATYNGSNGNNTYSGTSGADSIVGNGGNDSLSGNAGNDTIIGGGTQPTTALDLNWNLQGGDGTNIAKGFTQNTGGINVTVKYTDLGPATKFQVETSSSSAAYVASGETYNSRSNAYIEASGNGDAAKVEFDFAAVSGSGLQSEVTNVSFRISDVDAYYGSGWIDEVRLVAYDADGNEVPVTLTAGGADVVTGQSVTAANGNSTASDVQGSVLVTIAGPVARFELVYGNGLSAGQFIQLTDVQFTATTSDMDTISGGDGDDSLLGGLDDDLITGDAGDDYIDGGEGNDTLDGGTGNDTIFGGSGDDYISGGAGRDSLTGGLGADTFVVNFGESDGDVIDGSEDNADESLDKAIDTLVINGRAKVVYDPEDSESGVIHWANGDTTTFTNIEKITHVPCFTPGTMVETLWGPMPVEDVMVGDKLLTRDNGHQEVRWVGRRDFSAAELVFAPHLCPVRIAAGALGNGLPAVDMIVSPQHRMLVKGPACDLLFGENEALAAAVHLVGQPGITRVAPRDITYVHVMFEEHEIILADGAWSESFQPGDLTLAGMDDAARAELFEIFPKLREAEGRVNYSAARLSLKAHEVRVLMAS